MTKEIIGTGVCRYGYYAGFDNKGYESEEDCFQVCKEEEDCDFASFEEGKACSRYSGHYCDVNLEYPTRTLMAKRYSSGKQFLIVLILYFSMTGYCAALIKLH